MNKYKDLIKKARDEDWGGVAYNSKKPMKIFKIENEIYISFDNGSVYVPHKKKILKDMSWKARIHVAYNPNTPTQTLKKLSEDENKHVREEVAYNPNTPTQTLKKLSEDGKGYVRAAVAKNPNTLTQILQKLSEDEREYVRRGVAKNPNTSIQILKKLAEDEDAWVKNKAQNTLKKANENIQISFR